MKYINFKRFKFSTIFKNINPRRYNFSKIFKLIDLKRFYLQNVYKFLDFIRINFKKIYKYGDISRLSVTKFTKYLNLKTYSFNSIKKIDFLSSKFLLLHVPISIIFFGFLYLAIPTFYSYEKSAIKNTICKSNNIKCIIKDEINYRFYPTPRLKIKNLTIKAFDEKKPTLVIKDVSIKLSFQNLLAKDKHKFKEIELKNFKANLDLKNFKKYKIFFNNQIELIPVIFKNGEILIHEENNYVASIRQTNIGTKFNKGLFDYELKGNFLNDDIYISLNRQNKDNKASIDLVLKMSNLNFLVKSNFFNSEKEKNVISGNFLIKKDKNKIIGIFDYKDNNIAIKKSNIKNAFIDGSLIGKITILPFFNFNLDLDLNSINFTKLYNYFLSLDEKKQKNLFNINNKINGKLNFSANKVYSKHNLVKSFESRLTFYNSAIKIEQLLLNLGKLGATDILGGISNDKKFTNFKFNSNIFVDNQKKFLSKFGIYNKENVPSNLFISGNFDLQNIKATIYEISDNNKFNVEDTNYIESEFNDIMLENGFDDLFNFQKLKSFLKSVISEKN